MIRFALHLRHTSLQVYKLLLEKFPMPSVSLLSKIEQGGVDSLKALKVLQEKAGISTDLILMVDEMYLHKAAQYQVGEYVGADEEGNLYKGIVAFMVVGLKRSTPFVVQAIPEVTFNGQWLCDKIASNIENLGNAGFCVRGLVADNHSSNVNAFTSLKDLFHSESKLFFEHSANHGKRTYMFFDTVHLIKNIRNNLLNAKKFVFPEFSYNQGNIQLHCPQGYIDWADLYNIYDKDKELKGNLRKAPKLSYQALHPGNNKQNVPLTLALFYETTIAAAKSYYPNREDVSGFLNVIDTWWTICNSKQRYSANPLGNAIVLNDNKTNFFHLLAFWVQEWSTSPYFLLTPQTSSALINTLRSQAMLIDELLNDGYDYILTARLQSDPIECRFRQLRSGHNYIWIHRRKLLKRSKCKDCEKKLTVHDQDLQNDQYLTLLSRGDLFVPPKELAEFVCSCFAILDFVEGDILSIGQVTRSAMYVLKYYGPKCEFCCQYHLDWGVKFASKIVVNIYFNNKQKQAKDCS